MRSYNLRYGIAKFFERPPNFGDGFGAIFKRTPSQATNRIAIVRRIRQRHF